MLETGEDAKSLQEQVEEQKAKPVLFGTFEGVFVPTLLTILGVIMYLREGWVVGNAGLLGAWLIILIAFAITTCTGLSLSSITTNIRIGAGGAFSIISQSLGLEVGGSIGIPLYLSQALAVAFSRAPCPLHRPCGFCPALRYRLHQCQACFPDPVLHPGSDCSFPFFRLLGRGPGINAGTCAVVGELSGLAGNRVFRDRVLEGLCGLLPSRHRDHGRSQHVRGTQKPEEKHPCRHPERNRPELSYLHGPSLLDCPLRFP